MTITAKANHVKCLWNAPFETPTKNVGERQLSASMYRMEEIHFQQQRKMSLSSALTWQQISDEIGIISIWILFYMGVLALSQLRLIKCKYRCSIHNRRRLRLPGAAIVWELDRAYNHSFTLSGLEKSWPCKICIPPKRQIFTNFTVWYWYCAYLSSFVHALSQCH